MSKRDGVVLPAMDHESRLADRGEQVPSDLMRSVIQGAEPRGFAPVEMGDRFNISAAQLLHSVCRVMG